MDIKNNLDFRTHNLEYYDNTGNNKYDYAEDGILRKTLPKILFKGNSILVTFLQMMDLKIIMILKYVDKLKNFKHISKY